MKNNTSKSFFVSFFKHCSKSELMDSDNFEVPATIKQLENINYRCGSQNENAVITFPGGASFILVPVIYEKNNNLIICHKED